MNFLQKALEGVNLPDQVFLPPIATAGKGGRKKKKAPDVEAMRQRIADECDPLGQLIALANGMPVVNFVIKQKDGKPEVELTYESASMTQRIAILEKLRDKLVPNISMNQPKKKEEEPEDDEWDEITRRRSAGVLEEKSG
jgi:hypothetical protein